MFATQTSREMNLPVSVAESVVAFKVVCFGSARVEP